MIKDDLSATDRNDLVSAAIAPEVSANLKSEKSSRNEIVESAVAKALAQFAKRIAAEKKSGKKISQFQKEVLAKIAKHITPEKKKLLMTKESRQRIVAKLTPQARDTLVSPKPQTP